MTNLEALSSAVNAEAEVLSRRLYELITSSMAPTREMRVACLMALADCSAQVIHGCSDGLSDDYLAMEFFKMVYGGIAEMRRDGSDT